MADRDSRSIVKRLCTKKSLSMFLSAPIRCLPPPARAQTHARCSGFQGQYPGFARGKFRSCRIPEICRGKKDCPCTRGTPAPAYWKRRKSRQCGFETSLFALLPVRGSGCFPSPLPVPDREASVGCGRFLLLPLGGLSSDL